MADLSHADAVQAAAPILVNRPVKTTTHQMVPENRPALKGVDAGAGVDADAVADADAGEGDKRQQPGQPVVENNPEGCKWVRTESTTLLELAVEGTKWKMKC